MDSRVSASDDRLDRALHVGLDDDAQLLGVAGLHLAIEVFERHLRGLQQTRLAVLGEPMIGDLPRRRLVGDDDERAAGLRHRRQTEDLDRRRRIGRRDLVPLVVDHGADAPGVRAADERIARMQRAFLDQHRRDRAAAAIELGLDDDAARRLVGVGLELEQVRLQEQHLEQMRQPLAGLRRHRHGDRVAAPVLRHQTVIRQALLDPIEVGLGLVDLVDGHDHRHVRRRGRG